MAAVTETRACLSLLGIKASDCHKEKLARSRRTIMANQVTGHIVSHLHDGLSRPIFHSNHDLAHSTIS